MFRTTITRIALAAFLSFFTADLNAQCSDCSSLEEAMKNPLTVRHLDLSNQGLLAVPAEVNAFTNLETLDLSDNLISEVTLTAVFRELHHLDLSGNVVFNPWKLELVGKAFPNVVRLDLSNCKIALLPAGMETLKNVTILDLSGNDLAFVPEELEALTQLSMLDLSDNRLKNVSYVLGTLWNLSRLDISGNPEIDLSAVLTSISMNPALTQLGIDASLISKASSRLLRTLPVEQLEIRGLNGALPSGVVGNTAIKELTLRNGTITNATAVQLAKMNGLSVLTLNTTDIPETLSKITQLDELRVISNEPVSISAFEQLGFLDKLDLLNTTVSVSAIESLTAKLPETSIVSATAASVPDFMTNTVAPMVPLETVTTSIPGAVASIVTVEDVRFEIPANSFLSSSGEVYTGPVDFAVKVYDNALDIALDGAPMTFTENGQTGIFSSAGMVDVRAYDDQGTALMLNPVDTILMRMPNRLPDESTDLFFFNEQNNQWDRSPQLSIYDRYLNDQLETTIDSINKLELSAFVNHQSIPRLYSLKVKRKRLDPSDLSFRSYRPKKPVFPKLSNKSQLLEYQYNHVGKLIARTSWKVDTLMSPELGAFMKAIRKSTKWEKQLPYTNKARLIRNMALTPDFVNDHYQLTFLYRDSLVSLPVYLNSSKKSASVMKDHAKFHKKLLAAEKKDRKENAKGQRMRTEKIRRYAAGNREALIQMLRNRAAGQSMIVAPAVNYSNSFSIPVLFMGLINCDRIMRPGKSYEYKLEDILVDQDGQEYDRPDFVRAAYSAYNGYQMPSASSISIYENSATTLLIPLSDDKIGIVKFPEGQPAGSKRTIGIVTSVSVTGATNAGIQRSIAQ